MFTTIDDGAGYPAELAEQFGLTKANVSNHLACLRGCGLVSTTEGRGVRYELADPRVAHALAHLVELALLPLTAASTTAGTGHEPPARARRRRRVTRIGQSARPNRPDR